MPSRSATTMIGINERRMRRRHSLDPFPRRVRFVERDRDDRQTGGSSSTCSACHPGRSYRQPHHDAQVTSTFFLRPKLDHRTARPSMSGNVKSPTTQSVELLAPRCGRRPAPRPASRRRSRTAGAARPQRPGGRHGHRLPAWCAPAPARTPRRDTNLPASAPPGDRVQRVRREQQCSGRATASTSSVPSSVTIVATGACLHMTGGSITCASAVTR